MKYAPDDLPYISSPLRVSWKVRIISTFVRRGNWGVEILKSPLQRHSDSKQQNVWLPKLFFDAWLPYVFKALTLVFFSALKSSFFGGLWTRNTLEVLQPHHASLHCLLLDHQVSFSKLLFPSSNCLVMPQWGFKTDKVIDKVKWL